MERESRKILGTLGRRRRRRPRTFAVSAHTNRVRRRSTATWRRSRSGSGQAGRRRRATRRAARVPGERRGSRACPRSPSPADRGGRAARPAAAAARSRARRRHGGDGGPRPPLPDARPPPRAAGTQHDPRRGRARRCRSPSCWWRKAGSDDGRHDRLQVRRDVGGRTPAAIAPAGRDRALARLPSSPWWWCRALARVTDALLALAAERARGRRRRARRGPGRPARPARGDRARARRAADAALPAIAADAAASRRELRPRLGRDAARRRSSTRSPAGASSGARRLVAAALEGAGTRRHLGRHPADHGHRRPLRPRHAVHAGAHRPGARMPPRRCSRPAASRSPRASSAPRPTGRPPRWAAAAPTSPRRCSARRSTPSGSRSGPTWTGS